MEPREALRSSQGHDSTAVRRVAQLSAVQSCHMGETRPRLRSRLVAAARWRYMPGVLGAVAYVTGLAAGWQNPEAFGLAAIAVGLLLMAAADLSTRHRRKL